VENPDWNDRKKVPATTPELQYLYACWSGVNADAVAVLHQITEIDGTVID
jgi:hypothetical protein